MDQSFARIDSILQSEFVISVKWLSNELNISIETSGMILKDYQSKNSHQTKCVYIIGGRTKDGNYRVHAVREDEVDEIKSNIFIGDINQSLFCIHYFNVTNFRALVQNMENAQALALFQNNDETFMRNIHGGVQCSSIKILSNTEKFSYQKRNQSIEKQPNSASIDQTVQSLFDKKKPITELKSKSSSTYASNFFSKTSTNEPMKVKMTTKKTKPSEDVVPKPSKISSTSQPNPMANDSQSGTEDAEWDDEVIYSSTPKLKEKRHVIPSSSSNLLVAKCQEESPQPMELDVIEEDEIEASVETKKKNLLVRGAMDDYFEDIQIAKYKESQPESSMEVVMDATSSSQIVKKKKQKLVEKMFQDEKGYLVTEMVLEDVTDDEMVVESKKSDAMMMNQNENVVNGSKKKSQVAAAPTKKKSSVVNSGVQKSVMSFFTKK